MARYALNRTTFSVPGVGIVTLAKGEECPEAWEEHAPKGTLRKQTKAATKSAEAPSTDDE